MSGNHNMYCSGNQPNIVEILRGYNITEEYTQVMHEAADEIERLRKERDELVSALRDMMNTLTDGPDDSDVYRVFDKARAALAKVGTDKGEK